MMISTKTFPLLIILVISFSNCIQRLFNISKIEPIEKGCNPIDGTYSFKINGTFIGGYTPSTLLYFNLESPSEANVLCIPYNILYINFLCYFSIVYYPLTEKKVSLKREAPSEYYYTFVNWEEYIENNGNTIDDNIECNPVINTTFIYNSIILNDSKLYIKGEWLDNSTIIKYDTNVDIILTNSSLHKISCSLNTKTKNEFICQYNYLDIPIIEDQLIASAHFVYKLEKKKDDGENKSNYINFNILILLLYLLFI